MAFGLWASTQPHGKAGGDHPNAKEAQTPARAATRRTSTQAIPSDDVHIEIPTRSPKTILSSLTTSSSPSVLAAAGPSILPAPPSSQPSIWDWRHYASNPITTLLPPVLAATAALSLVQFYRTYLRRIPGTAHISPAFFRRRSLLGRVTSVGDGDNFHLFHTPGGRLAGWGWLRHVPVDRRELKGRTIPIRLAGIDAPEGAHFGRPAQPYAAEALFFLQSYLQNRRVRCHTHRRDQYNRVIATVFLRRPPFFVPRQDVSLEMLRRGLATTYEAKTGVEFGGEGNERRYKDAEAEARRKCKGLWAGVGGRKGFFWGTLGAKRGVVGESPRGYKDRMKEMESGRRRRRQ